MSFPDSPPRLRRAAFAAIWNQETAAPGCCDRLKGMLPYLRKADCVLDELAALAGNEDIPLEKRREIPAWLDILSPKYPLAAKVKADVMREHPELAEAYP